MAKTITDYTTANKASRLIFESLVTKEMVTFPAFVFLPLHKHLLPIGTRRLSMEETIPLEISKELNVVFR